MEEIYNAIALARSKGLPKENYWLYFKRDGTKIEARKSENKRKEWIGFFVEDDTKLFVVAGVAQRKTNWRK